MYYQLQSLPTPAALRARLIQHCLQAPEPIYAVPKADIDSLIRFLTIQDRGAGLIYSLYKEALPLDTVPIKTIEGVRIQPAIAEVFNHDVNFISLEAATAVWLTPQGSEWSWIEHYPTAAGHLQYLHYGWAYECPLIKPFICLAAYLVDQAEGLGGSLFQLNLTDEYLFYEQRGVLAQLQHYRPDLDLDTLKEHLNQVSI